MKLSNLLLGGALLLAPSPLLAQDLESFAGMRFQFETPGARGAAMGGASEALHDTFSTNPAALAKIRERRLALDARHDSDETELIRSGTVGAFETTTVGSRSSGIRSAIVVLPTRAATFAVFVDEPLNVSSPSANLDRGETAAIQVGILDGRLVPVGDCRPNVECAIGYSDGPMVLRASSNITLRRIGTAAGFQAGPLSFGGSVELTELDQRSTTGFATHLADDRQLTWSGGAQWQISPVVLAGASYRSGARFDAVRVHEFPNIVVTEDTSFNTPSSYGAGIAFLLAPNLTFAFDARRVNYSDMTEPLRTLSTASARIPLTMPDVTELHAGAELLIASRIPVAIRAGWWHDPSHRLRAVDPATPGDDVFIRVPAAYFNLGLLDADENHLTAGIGVGERVRIDAAIDRSRHTTRGSLTVATRF